MAHIGVLMIGTPSDLDYIYENETHDSSSESASEQSFGYDYLSEEYGKKEYGYKDFFLKGSDIFEAIIKKTIDYCGIYSNYLEGYGMDILDLRDRDNWKNVCFDYDKKEQKTNEEIVDYLMSLPDDTKLFYCLAHV